VPPKPRSSQLVTVTSSSGATGLSAQATSPSMTLQATSPSMTRESRVASKERRLLSSAVPSPPTKTVTPRSSSSVKRVRPAPRPNLPDSVGCILGIKVLSPNVKTVVEH
jgi:hypothetical protein